MRNAGEMDLAFSACSAILLRPGTCAIVDMESPRIRNGVNEILSIVFTFAAIEALSSLSPNENFRAILRLIPTAVGRNQRQLRFGVCSSNWPILAFLADMGGKVAFRDRVVQLLRRRESVLCAHKQPVHHRMEGCLCW